jgi:anti-sigma B factor antagonist
MSAPILLRLPFQQLSARDHGGVTVVSLSGELDFLAMPALEACLHATRKRARSVADLTGLAFIDCACLSVLVRHSAEVRARDGSFALAGPQSAVRRVLSVTRLLACFEVHDTVGQAVAAGQGLAFLRRQADPGSSPAEAAPGPVQPAIRAVLRDVTTVTTAARSSPARVMTASPALWSALPGTPESAT